MKYRSEIDGLRAVAVIPVILFHAGFTAFSGGYVGVDVFFVISGYLITTIILSEMQADTFSLAHFYERRARRILPALFLVMLCSFVFAWFLLIPGDMKDFSASLIAVSFFSSNFYFWQDSGYWNTISELKPLIHTWSLAIEEQFYVLFPLALLLMRRYRKYILFVSLALLSLVSLSAAQWGAYHKPVATFYLLPTRGWELALGACIAILLLHKKQAPKFLHCHRYVNEVLGLSGLLLIGYAVVAFSDSTPFPSFYTLAPTMGAGLIIVFASTHTLVGRILSIKPVVGIGLISYSAYLWHQPILAFARHMSPTEPDQVTYGALAFLSLPLAFVSWRFVEKPFRNKANFSRASIFNYALSATGVFIVVGLMGLITNGFDFRTSNGQLSIAEIDEKLNLNYGLSSTCEESFTLASECRTDDQPEILVWGDSLAMHLVQGLLSSNPEAGIIQMTKSFCGPLFDVAPVIEPNYPPSWGQGCLDFNEQVRNWLSENNSVRYAVLSSAFVQYYAGELLQRNGDVSPSTIEIAITEFENTLDDLQQMGITPVIFSPPPTTGIDLGRCLARLAEQGSNLDACNFPISDISQRALSVTGFLQEISNNHAVVFLEGLTCINANCYTHFDDTFIYRDAVHLSQEGSAALGREFDFYNLITGQ